MSTFVNYGDMKGLMSHEPEGGATHLQRSETKHHYTVQTAFVQRHQSRTERRLPGR